MKFIFINANPKDIINDGFIDGNICIRFFKGFVCESATHGRWKVNEWEIGYICIFVFICYRKTIKTINPIMSFVNSKLHLIFM